VTWPSDNSSTEWQGERAEQTETGKWKARYNVGHNKIPSRKPTPSWWLGTMNGSHAHGSI